MRSLKVIPYRANLLKTIALEIASEKRSLEELQNKIIIFPSRRSSLYFRYYLTKTLNYPTMLPVTYTLDDLVENIAAALDPRPLIHLLDEVWELYKHMGSTSLKDKLCNYLESFDYFIPWGVLIVEALEALDSACIEISDNVGLFSESLDPNVCSAIANSLGELQVLRRNILQKLDRTSLGIRTRTCVEALKNGYKPEFMEGRSLYFVNVLFTGAFEQALLESCKEETVVFFAVEEPGEDSAMEHFKKLGFSIELSLVEKAVSTSLPSISYYEAPDNHHAISHLVDILPERTPGEPDSIAIILPDEGSLIPLLHELNRKQCGFDINITMGYPLRRSLVVSFILNILELQTSRVDDKYDMVSFMHLLKHPYTKKISEHPETLHLIEKVLRKVGSPYMSLEQTTETLKAWAGETDLMEGFNTIIDNLVTPFSPAPFSKTISIRAIIASLEKIIRKIFAEEDQKEKDGLRLPEETPFFERDQSSTNHPRGNLESLFARIFIKEVLRPIKMSEWAAERISDLYNVQRMVKELTDFIRIPFTGSPLKGLQIMGFWESNLLSFDKVYILNANEGLIPPPMRVNPLIPEEFRHKLKINDRESYNTINHRIFKGLVYGAQEVHLFCTSPTSGTNIMESTRARSRFVEELLWKHCKRTEKIEDPVKKVPIIIPQRILQRKDKIEKTDPLKEKIALLLANKISSTFLNTYLRCPLQFYYIYVLGLEPSMTMIEDELDRKSYLEIGILIHKTLQDYFRMFLGKEYTEESCDPKTLTTIFYDNFRKSTLSKRLGEEKRFFITETLKYRLEQYIRWLQASHPRFLVYWLEQPMDHTVSSWCPSQKSIKLKAVLDMIKVEDSSLVIIDYKTSGNSFKSPPSLSTFNILPDTIAPSSMEDYFDMLRHSVEDLQLPFYALVLNGWLSARKDCPEKITDYPLKACYHFIGASHKKYEMGIKDVADLKTIACQVERLITFLCNHLLESPFFGSTEEGRVCNLCDYKTICSASKL